MGFMDLTSSVYSRKHVDLSDARYQASDRLKQNRTQVIRSTFALYDTKYREQSAIQEILTDYELSDKKLQLGEILNKMVDLIVDMEDGVLDSNKNAIYAWKYSSALITLYEDQLKRNGSLNSFDNHLKMSIINSAIFMKRYPGVYTVRTNFFDKKIRALMIQHVYETFKEEAIPGIHKAAIVQSKKIAEKHSNPLLDRIVNAAIASHHCTADAYFKIEKDNETELYRSVNTVILHMNNGYDMSIVGYSGTEHDDKFTISLFDTNKIKIESHGIRLTKDELQEELNDAATKDAISPLGRLLKEEQRKNEILSQQYHILSDIRPMIKTDVLKLEAAASVVGEDYIWGCNQFRQEHEDLPESFTINDVKLPEYIPEPTKGASEPMQIVLDAIAQTTNKTHTAQVGAEQAQSHIGEMTANGNKTLSGAGCGADNSTQGDYMTRTQLTPDNLKPVDNTKKQPPVLQNIVNAANSFAVDEDPKETKSFSASSTLLPGLVFQQEEEVDESESVTQNAESAEDYEDKFAEKTSLFKNVEMPEKETVVEQPSSSTDEATEMKDDPMIDLPRLDNLDSLFA